MPVIKLYHHGLTAGVPPTVNTHLRALRGEVGGWSNSSTRSNTRFLYSVRESGLTGYGLALTLTIRDCPFNHEAWQTLRTAFFKRMRRLGMIRAHWLTEWQRRGVPHLHCAVWFDSPLVANIVVQHWLSVTHLYGTARRSQAALPITDSVGWFKYLSKHASRGIQHYQRSPENIPEGWKKTGRMWGYLGDWPLDSAMKFDLDNSGFHAFRRIVRNRSIAEARHSKEWRRLKYVRSMLTCNERPLSTVRGVSEWMPMDLQIQVISYLAANGHTVEQVD